MKMKKSSNYPLVRDCSICKILNRNPIEHALYDMPLRVGGRVTWGFACHEHALRYGPRNAWSLGTQINGPLERE